jgi:hypothetical protein
VYIDNPLNIIKVNLDGASAFGMLGITYERVINFRGSILLKVEYLGKYNPFTFLPFVDDTYKNTNSISGVGFTPEIRYYGSERYAPLGLFIGAYVPIKFANVNVPSSIVNSGFIYTIPKQNLSYTLVGIGADLGYQHIFKKRLSIELVAGVSICKGSFSENNYSTGSSASGNNQVQYLPVKDGNIGNAFYPRGEMSIGWAF